MANHDKPGPRPDELKIHFLINDALACRHNPSSHPRKYYGILKQTTNIFLITCKGCKGLIAKSFGDDRHHTTKGGNGYQKKNFRSQAMQEALLRSLEESRYRC